MNLIEEHINLVIANLTSLWLGHYCSDYYVF